MRNLDRSRPAVRALALCCAWLSAFLPVPPAARANPQADPAVNGGNPVVSGAAIVERQGGALTIRQSSDRAVFRWKTFDIEVGERTEFKQPGASSVALNRVSNDVAASRIMGNLTATGHVYVINPAGVLFGKSAVVNTQGLVAATHFDASKLQGLDESSVALLNAQAKPGATIRNEGLLVGAGAGAVVALIGQQVEQAGAIQVQDGQVLLAAGASATLIDPKTGLGFVIENQTAAPQSLNPLASAGVAGALASATAQQGGAAQATAATVVGGEVRLVGGKVEVGTGKAELRAANDVVLGNGAKLSTGDADINVEAGGSVRFRALQDSQQRETVIETDTGNIRVVAGDSVDLNDAGRATAAIRSRGHQVQEKDGDVTRTFIRNKRPSGEIGGNIFVWAKGGDVDSGVVNRWLDAGSIPIFEPDQFAALKIGVDPKFDPTPVHKSGILGIGSEAGGDVTVIAGRDIKTRLPVKSDEIRSGGSASGLEAVSAGGTVRDGSHIGVFGEERELQTASSGAFLEPTEIEVAAASTKDQKAKLLMVAGGDIVGDVMMRNGTATLRAGYALTGDGQSAAAAGTLPRDAAAIDRPDAPLLDGSALGNREPFDRGWLGTLPNPLTVDLVRGSVDGKGYNGVAVRAIENPSLVYPLGNGRVSTYGAADSAALEAQRGDVVLLGTDSTLRYPSEVDSQNAQNELVRHLPPRLTVRTHDFERGAEKRGGDYVQLNDFVQEPSPQGDLLQFVRGEIRTANGFGTGTAQIDVSLTAKGTTAQSSFTLLPGTQLKATLPAKDPKDPPRAVTFTVNGSIQAEAATAAFPATGDVRFFVDSGAARNGVTISAGKFEPKTGTCSGTCVVSRDGKIYEVVRDTGLPAPQKRFSEGAITFTVNKRAEQPIQIAPSTLLEYRFTNDQGRSEAIPFSFDGAVIPIGARSVTVPVRALTPGRDAPPRSLQIVGAVPAGVQATNFEATTRPPWVDVQVRHVESGAVGNTLERTITGLVQPVDHVTRVVNLRPFTQGSDALTEVLLTVVAEAGVKGPAGNIPAGTVLTVDPSTLHNADPSAPPIRVEDLTFVAAGESASSSDPARLVPGVYRSLFIQKEVTTEDGVTKEKFLGTRIDPDPALAGAPTADTSIAYLRSDPGTTALLEQSDADPRVDRRGNFFQHPEYYRQCRAGSSCLLDGAPPTRADARPNHSGNGKSAVILAQGGLHNIAFDLAMPTTVFSAKDIVDLGLASQHSRPDDVTQILVPQGKFVFDEQSESAKLLVSGPGLARVLVGVVPHTAALTGFGDAPVPPELTPAHGRAGDADPRGITKAEFKLDGPPELKDAVFDGIDRPTGSKFPPPPDGVLTAGELPFVPTAVPGSGTLTLKPPPRTTGLITAGNLRNAKLPTGGANLQIVTAGSIELGEFGSLGTLQGGDVRISSIGGGLKGAEVVNSLDQRGIFTVASAINGSNATVLTDGAGDIRLDTHAAIDPGGLPVASLSSGNILLRARDGSITFGKGKPFGAFGVFVAPATRTPGLSFSGAGLAALPNGTIKVETRKDINLGAGVRGGNVRLDAGGSVNQGTGGVKAENISIDAGGSISGSFSASGNVQIGSGSVSAGSSVQAGGFVGGGGPTAGGSNAGKVSAENVLRSREAPVVPSGLAGFGSGAASRGVLIDVSSRPCGPEECN